MNMNLSAILYDVPDGGMIPLGGGGLLSTFFTRILMLFVLANIAEGDHPHPLFSHFT